MIKDKEQVWIMRGYEEYVTFMLENYLKKKDKTDTIQRKGQILLANVKVPFCA